MRAGDLDAVLAIERQAFAEPWPRRFFEQELARPQPAWAVVAEQAGRVAGYLVAWMVNDEVHLGNLAVATPYRRRGVGQALLDHLISGAARRGAGAIALEVRVGNRVAIALYARNRFRPAGLRRGYYHGREDALVMIRELERR